MGARELEVIRSSRAPSAFVGRQPIFDNSEKVHAYELLFRSGESNSADHIDDQIATSQVIYNSLMEIGLDDLVGESLAFINFSRESLIDGIADLLPPSRVVVELLETIEIDDELIATVEALVEQGYLIALDDFVYEPKWEPLLRLAAIVKLDVANHSVEEIREFVDKLKPYDVELLAEKVETQAEHEVFQEMGFTYYQGYFYSKPSMVKRDRLSDNQFALLELATRLQDPDIEIEEVKELLSHTVSLNYQLLRYVNSASAGLHKQLTSIQEAVVFIGLRKIKELASMLALSSMNNKSSELVYAGLTRAMNCQLLSQYKEYPNHDEFFVVGLFSILEGLLDRPIVDVVRQLPLTEEIGRALVAHEGVMGEALLTCVACETGDWQHISFRDLDKHTVYSAYLEAIRWARRYSV